MSNIVFLDATTDYPNRFSAGNTKVELLAKGLIECGDSITVINSPREKKNGKLYKKEIYKGIVCHTFEHPKNILAIINGYLKIEKIVRQAKITDENNIIIISDPPFFTIYLWDLLIAKLNGYKLVVIFHEWHIAVDSISKKRKLGFFFFDYFFGYFCNAILPISNFLWKKCEKFKKPMLKIPIVAEFDSNKMGNSTEESYFLYCGGAQYINIIFILFKHFEKLVSKREDISLVLVLYGETKYLDLINEEIVNRNLHQKIKIMSSIPYDELIRLYSKALALLIPLSDTLQDKARFSQKIAEYLSSKRPIITTDIGEIPFYFKDGETAFIANSLDGDDYFEKMSYVIEHQDIASQIGYNGYELGLKEFNNKIVARKLHEFILTV